MTALLSLVRLRPDMAALARWAIRRGYLPRRGTADPGYALHAALKAGLGDMAPQPFALRSVRGRPDELLGYARAAPDSILAAAALPPMADPEVAEALALSGSDLEARVMPADWPAGARFSFELRARPVVRSRAQGRTGRSHEVDAAAWAAATAAETPAKEKAYTDWLAARLAVRGARLLDSELAALRRCRILRRPVVDGERRSVLSEGPDALFRGTLEIGDPAAFADGLARGVGRHRAFGFGCLLLAPPGVRT